MNKIKSSIVLLFATMLIFSQIGYAKKDVTSHGDKNKKEFVEKTLSEKNLKINPEMRYFKILMMKVSIV